ncbi:MAG: cysteine desulfurase [Ignavibacteria bacterium]|nr:cysteine desulfurase [Ignavibacteria bacterium]MBI3765664.1 cysteine desulfurase [Ignavibacteriales bacterium]
MLTPVTIEKSFDVDRIRTEFPILKQRVNGKPLAYLDNAATSQKPQVVIDAMNRYYLEENSNIHRGVHFLSDKATQSYEAARKKIQRFINAASHKEIIFVRGTTEAINLVAQSYGRKYFHAGDEMIISAMEHHSNIVPWQMICEEKGLTLRVIPMNDKGELFIDKFETMLNPKTKFVAVVHVSNALGTINPVQQIIEIAHRRGVPVIVDGAQAVPHMKVDVRDLDCDFYAFSAHKMYGPTGVGVLYGKQHLLEAMPPYQGGGDMIKSVTYAKTTYNDLPNKFEAGTPNIVGGVGLGATIDFMNTLDFEAATAHEHELLEYATEVLTTIKGLRIIGTAREKASVVSFVLEGIHPHDIGTILDDDGIAIRTGHHCAQPVMQCFGIPATARASFAMYNTKEEIDALVKGIYKVIEVFS